MISNNEEVKSIIRGMLGNDPSKEAHIFCVSSGICHDS